MHTTFQYAGTEGKRHRLREGMVFYDPPEYYDAPGTNRKYHQYLCHALHIFLIFLGCIFLASVKVNVYHFLCIFSVKFTSNLMELDLSCSFTFLKLSLALKKLRYSLIGIFNH